MSDARADLCALLAPSGLALRGVFPLEDGEAPAGFSTGVLVGHLGGGFWPAFEAWHDARPGTADPLDEWSKEIIGAAASAAGGRAVFPSDKPFAPFQRWAMRAEGLRPGPLGVLMHPEAGPWHAYRGAILFERSFQFMPEAGAHPCDTCETKPCLTACPVMAISAEAFNVRVCRAHLATPEGAPCMDGGCLARNACPVGSGFRYSAAQQSFHQRAFRGAR